MGLWIRIDIKPDPDKDPATRLNPDPDPIRIHNRTFEDRFFLSKF
jgi:hypothetical protein